MRLLISLALFACLFLVCPSERASAQDATQARDDVVVGLLRNYACMNLYNGFLEAFKQVGETTGLAEVRLMEVAGNVDAAPRRFAFGQMGSTLPPMCGAFERTAVCGVQNPACSASAIAGLEERLARWADFGKTLADAFGVFGDATEVRSLEPQTLQALLKDHQSSAATLSAVITPKAFEATSNNATEQRVIEQLAAAMLDLDLWLEMNR